MKICNDCGYVEYWGVQAALVCPNCSEVYMEVFFSEKTACNSDSGKASSPSYKEMPNAGFYRCSEESVGSEDSSR